MIAYPVTTHCAADAAKPSSRWMEASATFTMLKSSTTMKEATRMSTSAARLYLGWGGFGAPRGVAAEAGVAAAGVEGAGVEGTGVEGTGEGGRSEVCSPVIVLL